MTTLTSTSSSAQQTAGAASLTHEHSKATKVVRTMFGAAFVMFGLNGFLHFMSPPPMSEGGMTFMGAMMASGYFFPFLKATEIISGLLILSGRMTALGLVILAPIIVNILAFHLALAPASLPMAVMLVGIQGWLAWKHRAAYRGLFDCGC
jgi:Na+/phosphate symporter